MKKSYLFVGLYCWAQCFIGKPFARLMSLQWFGNVANGGRIRPAFLLHSDQEEQIVRKRPDPTRASKTRLKREW